MESAELSNPNTPSSFHWNRYALTSLGMVLLFLLAGFFLWIHPLAGGLMGVLAWTRAQRFQRLEAHKLYRVLRNAAGLVVGLSALMLLSQVLVAFR